MWIPAALADAVRLQAKATRRWKQMADSWRDAVMWHQPEQPFPVPPPRRGPLN